MSKQPKKSGWLRNYGLLTAMLIAIVAGCIAGALFPATEESIGAKVLEPLGTVFINLMFCIVVPMVFASIAGAVANMGSRKRAGKIMGVTIGTFVVTGAIAAAIMYVLMRIIPPVLVPWQNIPAEELGQYAAWYADPSGEKTLYLTFDAGYEHGCTAPILDTLKKHQVPAAFFVVGHFLETSPDLVKRMVNEGHTVANHTFHHPDMSKISSLEAFQSELSQPEALYETITGQPMAKYYRPPQGRYSVSSLKMAKELGYQTFFWSLAYVDWYQDDQPSKEEACEKLLGRIHPGAIILLHSTSSTNAEILDELLTKWKEMGYAFGTLADLCEK